MIRVEKKNTQLVKRMPMIYLFNFHPSGEPEAFICCVAKDLK